MHRQVTRLGPLRLGLAPLPPERRRATRENEPQAELGGRGFPGLPPQLRDKQTGVSKGRLMTCVRIERGDDEEVRRMQQRVALARIQACVATLAWAAVSRTTNMGAAGSTALGCPGRRLRRGLCHCGCRLAQPPPMPLCMSTLSVSGCRAERVQSAYLVGMPSTLAVTASRGPAWRSAAFASFPRVTYA
jgi:hypothetical protein